MKGFLLFILITFFLSGCASEHQQKKVGGNKTIVEINEKRVPINSDGDFKGKPLTGAQFNHIISEKYENGSWEGYVVHSITTAPWNNTWSTKGLSVPKNVIHAGTYLIHNFYKDIGNDGRGSPRDMAGWYGFNVNMAETTKHSHYMGINAFGVSANVEVLNTRGAEIVFGSTQIDDKSYASVWADIDVIGQIPSDTSIKDLKIEYLARITERYPSYIERNNPMLSEPTKSVHETQYFTGKLLAARLINARTGVVYPVKLEWVFRTRDAFPEND